MKASLVITIALFTIFTISEISCEKTCMQFRDKCIYDSDCCSNNCFMAGRLDDRFCMDPVNTTAAGKVEHGLCSYNASLHNKESSDRTFQLMGLNAAHALLSIYSEIKLTNTANNKTINVTINNYLQPNNETLLELTKEVARELGVKDGETIPCSIFSYEKEPDYSTFKKMIVVCTTFYVVVFIVMTFL